MAKLLINISDIVKLTGFDGNIDNDTINPFIFMAEDSEIKRILGDELYTKISEDYNSNTLTGDYLMIYNKYISVIEAYFSASFFLQLGTQKVSQNGAYLVTPEKTEQIPDEQKQEMAAKYEKMAVKKEIDFVKVLDELNLPERPAPSTIKPKSNFPWIRVK